MNSENSEKRGRRNRWMISYSDFATVLLAVFIMLYASTNAELNKLKLELAKNPPPKEQTQEKPQEQKPEVRSLKEIEGVEVIEQKGATTLRLGEQLLFDEGSAQIKSESKPTLDKVANILTKNGNQIKIEGHSDNVPIKNSQFSSNWELSSARASNIVEYLTSEKKLNKKRFTILSHADNVPVAENSTPQGRAKNRRVDIIIME